LGSTYPQEAIEGINIDISVQYTIFNESAGLLGNTQLGWPVLHNVFRMSVLAVAVFQLQITVFALQVLFDQLQRRTKA
jgi:hypothetical protein